MSPSETASPSRIPSLAATTVSDTPARPGPRGMLVLVPDCQPAEPAKRAGGRRRAGRLAEALSADLLTLHRADSALRTELDRLRQTVRPGTEGAGLFTEDEATALARETAQAGVALRRLAARMKGLRVTIQQRRVWGLEPEGA